MQVCRICLSTDRKMYHLDSNSIHLYEQITGLSFVLEDPLPKFVCWECGYYMSKYFDFKSRAVTSYCILTDVLNQNGVITKSLLESANWNPYKSSLIQSDILWLVVKEDEDLEEIEEDSLVSDVKIKAECDDSIIFQTENDEFNTEIADILTTAEDSAKNESKNKELPCNAFEGGYVKNTKSVFKQIDTETENDEFSTENAEKSFLESLLTAAEDSVKNESKNKELPCNACERGHTKNTKSVFKQIDTDLMVVTKLRTVDEQIAELQLKKQSKNYKNSPHKCEICFRGFLDIAAYERHMKKHSEASGFHECPICKFRFRTRDLQKGHTRNTHSYKFCCSICEVSTNNLFSALQHQNYHKGTIYECPHCSQVFSYRTTYLSHMRIKHPSDITCKHCGHAFLNERGLKYHMFRNHYDEQIPADGPSCARCDLRFSCQDALDTHRRVSARHADERTAGVVEPARNSNEIYNKSRYKGSSEPLFRDGPVPCEQCGEPMQSPTAYNIHFKTAHKGETRTRYFHSRKQSSMCDICGKICQSEGALRRHSYAHSSTKQFKCDRCGRLFQIEGLLYNHQRYHCGNRVDHPCSVCGRTFSSKGNLQRHVGKHTGVQIKCEFCDKVFHCKANMQAHVGYVHKQKPWPKRNRGRGRTLAERQPKVMQSPTYEAELDADTEMLEE